MASAGHLTPAADQRESERARFANILLSGLQSGRMDEVIQQTKQGNTGKMQAAQVKEIKEQATSSLLEALNSGKFDAVIQKLQNDKLQAKIAKEPAVSKVSLVPVPPQASPFSPGPRRSLRSMSAPTLSPQKPSAPRC